MQLTLHRGHCRSICRACPRQASCLPTPWPSRRPPSPPPGPSPPPPPAPAAAATPWPSRSRATQPRPRPRRSSASTTGRAWRRPARAARSAEQPARVQRPRRLAGMCGHGMRSGSKQQRLRAIEEAPALRRPPSSACSRALTTRRRAPCAWPVLPQPLCWCGVRFIETQTCAIVCKAVLAPSRCFMQAVARNCAHVRADLRSMGLSGAVPHRSEVLSQTWKPGADGVRSHRAAGQARAARRPDRPPAGRRRAPAPRCALATLLGSRAGQASTS